MQATKITLFGGALLSAGVTQAQNLEFADNGLSPVNYTLGHAYVSDSNYAYSRDSSYDPAVIAPDQRVAAGNWRGSSSIRSFALVVQANAGSEAGADTFAIGRAYAFVVQSRNTDLSMFWDFERERPGLPPEDSFIRIFDFSANEIVFEVNMQSATPRPAVGEDAFTLRAGVPYGITLSAEIFGPEGSTGSVLASLQVAVPTPATAASLITGVGLAVRRRR
ncbi:MAG: hypothetical protein AAF937_12540 [Planctomycetota bacterium]